MWDGSLDQRLEFIKSKCRRQTQRRQLTVPLHSTGMRKMRHHVVSARSIFLIKRTLKWKTQESRHCQAYIVHQRNCNLRCFDQRQE